MPTSSPENQHVISTWFKLIKPKTIIDIGAGEGTYAKLLKKKNQHWTAIEAWAVYVEQFKLRELYQQIIIADARYIDSKHLKADLIIMGDMLEHMKKHEAQQLIDTCKKQAKNIIISVPMQHLDQEAYEGNWFEEHIDHWHYQEMLDYLGGNTKAQNGEVVARYWWSS